MGKKKVKVYILAHHYTCVLYTIIVNIGFLVVCKKQGANMVARILFTFARCKFKVCTKLRGFHPKALFWIWKIVVRLPSTGSHNTALITTMCDFPLVL